MYIYAITNSITGKIYIGQHKGNNLKKYLQDKFSHAKRNRGSSPLFNSMRKHPKEVWSIEPLFEGIETKEELDRLERLLIALYDTRNPEIGYNICRGGEGFTGTMSEETKAKLKEVGNPVFLRSAEQEEKRKAAVEQARQEQGGSFLTEDSVKKIKTKRALQDESTRIEACRKWADEHPEEMRTRMSREVHSLGGKSGSREAKQRAAAASVASGSLIKAKHVRWHTNRGLINPNCSFCTTQVP